MLDEVKRALEELEDIQHKVIMEAKNWWWLDFGNEPIISIRTLEVKDGKPRLTTTPRISVITALHEISESLQTLLTLKPKEAKREYFEAILESARNVKKVIENIRDADRLIARFSALTKFSDILVDSGREKHKLSELAREAISWIVERLKQNPLEWEKERDFFERTLIRLEKMVFKERKSSKGLVKERV